MITNLNGNLSSDDAYAKGFWFYKHLKQFGRAWWNWGDSNTRFSIRNRRFYPSKLQLHILSIFTYRENQTKQNWIINLLHWKTHLIGVPLNGIQPISTPEFNGRGLCETDILKRRLLTVSPTLILCHIINTLYVSLDIHQHWDCSP